MLGLIKGGCLAGLSLGWWFLRAARLKLQVHFRVSARKFSKNGHVGVLGDFADLTKSGNASLRGFADAVFSPRIPEFADNRRSGGTFAWVSGLNRRNVEGQHLFQSRLHGPFAVQARNSCNRNRNLFFNQREASKPTRVKVCNDEKIFAKKPTVYPSLFRSSCRWNFFREKFRLRFSLSVFTRKAA